jgi:hypothetical protein
LLSLITFSCSDWLDGAVPKDKNLEEKQFSTEVGINSVMNGLYQDLASENLYGGKLTIKDVDLLAHYYYYAENLLNQETTMGFFNHISGYKYTENDTKAAFYAIWSNAYQLIYRINNFIENVSQADVISDEKKNILLGEAYGLRAFVHFDLFRLFGDINGTQNIPYNHSTEVIPHEPVADINAFYALLFQDVNSALELLQNDPIRKDGILKVSDIASGDYVPATEIFAGYIRNHRLNYYAVQALYARALLFKGDIEKSAEIAESVLSESFGATDKPFYPINKNEVVNDRNYIFYSEILFGIFNLDLHSRWDNYTSGTILGQTYTVLIDNLQNNIFRHDNTNVDIGLWEDIRAIQWLPSKIGLGQYISRKFEHYTKTAYNANIDQENQYFQPLIRTAELIYIIIENKIKQGQIADAVTLLNDFRFSRGLQYESLPDPATATEEIAKDILETEYYKEFYAEGQAFFYMKRIASPTIINAYNQGRVNISPEKYIIPIPEKELEY